MSIEDKTEHRVRIDQEADPVIDIDMAPKGGNPHATDKPRMCLTSNRLPSYKAKLVSLYIQYCNLAESGTGA